MSSKDYFAQSQNQAAAGFGDSASPERTACDLGAVSQWSSWPLTEQAFEFETRIFTLQPLQVHHFDRTEGPDFWGSLTPVLHLSQTPGPSRVGPGQSRVGPRTLSISAMKCWKSVCTRSTARSCPSRRSTGRLVDAVSVVSVVGGSGEAMSPAFLVDSYKM